MIYILLEKKFFSLIIVYCPAGYEVVRNGETPIDCVQCSLGFFKAEPGNYGCSPCPFGANGINANTTNEINGSQSVEDCTLGT